MRILPNAWPSSEEYKGIKFISQLFDEMFFDYTADSYRTPALSTLHRAYEGHMAAQQIIQQDLNPKTVRPIVQELVKSICNDPIAKSILSDRIGYLCERLNTSQDKPKSAKDLFAYVRDALDDVYGNEAKVLLKQSIYMPDKKEYNQKLCREFAAYLINTGYTRQYVRHKINEILLTGDVRKKPEDILEDFLQSFNETDYRFHTYVWVNNKFKGYLKKFSSFNFEEIKIDTLDSQIKNSSKRFFKQHKAKSLLCLTDIDDKDPAGARNFVSTMLHVHRSFIYSINPESGFLWDERIFVYEPESKKGALLAQHQAPLLRRSSVSSNEAVERTERRIGIVFKHFNANSQRQIFRALTSFSNAFNSESLETQFVSVWSSLEVILPDPIDKARIISYVEYVTSCAAIYYSYRHFSWLFSDMKIGYGDSFLRILEIETEGETQLTKFILIMCAAEHHDTRLKLCELAADNPLALWRLHLIHQNHKTPAAINKFIKRHTERVEWQMHRIYRTRNSLLHSGQRLPYLESVLMNVQEYFSNIMDALEDRSQKRTAPSEKDTVLKEILVDRAILERKLKSGGENDLTSEDVLHFVWLPHERF